VSVPVVFAKKGNCNMLAYARVSGAPPLCAVADMSVCLLAPCLRYHRDAAQDLEGAGGAGGGRAAPADPQELLAEAEAQAEAAEVRARVWVC
jgi:hypothetical protein